MPTKICFLSILHQYNDTRVFFKEARSLAKAGFDVTHLASGQIPSYIDDGVKINIYSSLTRKGILGRVLKFFPILINALRIDADCYHCNEIETWIVGCLIKLLRSEKKIIFDVHEHYPGFFENPFYPKWVNFIGRPITLFLYRILTPLTDNIVVVLPSLANDFPKTKKQIIVVANFASLQFQNLNRENVSEDVFRHFLTGKTAIHTGAISKVRGWPQILVAISKMKYQGLNIMFLGDIQEKDEIIAEAQKLYIANRVSIHPKVSYELMMKYLLYADIGMIVYLPDMQNHVLAWPTKFCDYMMAKLPVIAPNTMSRVAEAIRENQSGLLVDASNPDEIACALDYLCINEEESALMGARGFKSVTEKYNWEIEAEKLIEMYKQVAKEIQ